MIRCFSESLRKMGLSVFGSATGDCLYLAVRPFSKLVKHFSSLTANNAQKSHIILYAVGINEDYTRGPCFILSTQVYSECLVRRLVFSALMNVFEFNICALFVFTTSHLTAYNIFLCADRSFVLCLTVQRVT